MTKQELARALDLSIRQIENLVVDGMPHAKRGRRLLFEAAAIVWYFRRKLQEFEARTPPSVEEARARRELAQAELAEYELAEKRRQMLSIEDHDRILGRLQDRLRAKHLNLPGKWAPQIVGLRSIPEGQARLEEMMHECLLELTRVADQVEEDSATYGPADASQRLRARAAGRRRRPPEAPRPPA